MRYSPFQASRCGSYYLSTPVFLHSLHSHPTSSLASTQSNILWLCYDFLDASAGTLLGNQVIDSVVASEAAQRDVALDRALAEVESLQSRLSEAEKHGEQFRLIGTTTEGMLRELRERSAASKVAQEEELLRLVL